MMLGGGVFVLLIGAVKVALDQANKQKKQAEYLSGQRHPYPQGKPQGAITPENEGPWTYHPPS
jgi:hypothetical protein